MGSGAGVEQRRSLAELRWHLLPCSRVLIALGCALCVKRDLVCVKRDLVCVKRDLVCYQES